MGPSGLRGGLATLWANLRYTWCQGASTASPASKDTSTCEGQQAARPGAGVSGNPCHPSIQPGYCCWRRPFSQIPELNNGYRKNSSASCGASSRGEASGSDLGLAAGDEGAGPLLRGLGRRNACAREKEVSLGHQGAPGSNLSSVALLQGDLEQRSPSF